jgi:hypothetical protein
MREPVSRLVPFVAALLLLPISRVSAAGAAAAISVSYFEADVKVSGYSYDSADYWQLGHRAVFWKAASNYLNISGDDIKIESPCASEAHRRLGETAEHSFHVDWIVLLGNYDPIKISLIKNKLDNLTMLSDTSDHHRKLGGASSVQQLFLEDWKAVYDASGLVSAPASISMSVSTAVERKHAVLEERCSGHHGHPSLFQLRQYLKDYPLDPVEILMCFMALITITIIFEELVHHTDHMLEFKAPHFSNIFESICKELMILGFISFTIFIFEQLAQLSSEAFYLEMELVHIVIFFVAMILALKAVWLLIIMDIARVDWDQCCNQPYEQLKKAHDEQHNQLGYSFTQTKRAINLHICRVKFLDEHQLNAKLDFGKYLWIALAGDISNMIDIDVSTWVLASIIGMVYYGVCRACIETYKPDWDVHMMIGSGWVNFGVSCLTCLYIVPAQRNLLRHCGFDEKSGKIEGYLDRTLQNPSLDPFQGAEEKLKKRMSSGRTVGNVFGTLPGSGSQLRRTPPPGKLAAQVRAPNARPKPATQTSRVSLNFHVEKSWRSNSEGDRALGKLKANAVSRNYREVWDLHDVFPFSAVLFNKLLDVLFLYDCFYFAIFVCYFASSITAKQIMLILAPFVFNTLIIHSWVIKKFFFLKAISHLKSEVLGCVIEEMEEENILRGKILERMREALERSDISAVALKTLFQKWDVNGDNSVDKRELRLVFESLHIHLSDEKFKKVVRCIDLNQDGTIDYDEFVNMCYPEHEWADKGKGKHEGIEHMVEHAAYTTAATVVSAAATIKNRLKSHITPRGSQRNGLLKRLHSHNRHAKGAGAQVTGVSAVSGLSDDDVNATVNNPMMGHPSSLSTHEARLAGV